MIIMEILIFFCPKLNRLICQSDRRFDIYRNSIPILVAFSSEFRIWVNPFLEKTKQERMIADPLLRF